MKSTIDSTRRKFFCNAGAVLAVPLAAAAASAAAGEAEDGAALRARLALLEDATAIRELQRAYARHVNAGSYDDVATLFADPQVAPLDSSIRTLTADPLGADDMLAIAADGLSATARVHCSVESESPIGPSCPLVEMARAQGGGVIKRSERGVLEGAYVKVEGVWKIGRLEFRAA